MWTWPALIKRGTIQRSHRKVGRAEGIGFHPADTRRNWNGDSRRTSAVSNKQIFPPSRLHVQSSESCRARLSRVRVGGSTSRRRGCRGGLACRVTYRRPSAGSAPDSMGRKLNLQRLGEALHGAVDGDFERLGLRAVERVAI